MISLNFNLSTDFDRRNVRYEDLHCIKPHHWDYFIRQTDPFTSGIILDAGCGYGSATRELLARKGSTGHFVVDLVDESRVQLELAETIPKSLSNGHLLNYYNNSISDFLEGKSSLYDVIFLKMVLHECDAEEQRQIVEKALYALKPSGVLLLWDFVNPKLVSDFLQAISTKKDELAGLNQLALRRKYLSLKDIYNLFDDRWSIATQYFTEFRLCPWKWLETDFDNDRTRMDQWVDFIRNEEKALSPEATKYLSFRDEHGGIARSFLLQCGLIAMKPLTMVDKYVIATPKKRDDSGVGSALIVTLGQAQKRYSNLPIIFIRIHKVDDESLSSTANKDYPYTATHYLLARDKELSANEDLPILRSFQRYISYSYGRVFHEGTPVKGKILSMSQSLMKLASEGDEETKRRTLILSISVSNSENASVILTSLPVVNEIKVTGFFVKPLTSIDAVTPGWNGKSVNDLKLVDMTSSPTAFTVNLTDQGRPSQAPEEPDVRWVEKSLINNLEEDYQKAIVWQAAALARMLLDSNFSFCCFFLPPPVKDSEERRTDDGLVFYALETCPAPWLWGELLHGANLLWDEIWNQKLQQLEIEAARSKAVQTVVKSFGHDAIRYATALTSVLGGVSNVGEFTQDEKMSIALPLAQNLQTRLFAYQTLGTKQKDVRQTYEDDIRYAKSKISLADLIRCEVFTILLRCAVEEAEFKLLSDWLQLERKKQVLIDFALAVQTQLPPTHEKHRESLRDVLQINFQGLEGKMKDIIQIEFIGFDEVSIPVDLKGFGKKAKSLISIGLSFMISELITNVFRYQFYPVRSYNHLLPLSLKFILEKDNTMYNLAIKTMPAREPATKLSKPDPTGLTSLDFVAETLGVSLEKRLLDAGGQKTHLPFPRYDSNNKELVSVIEGIPRQAMM